MVLKVTILDGYTDEPAGLGVPPYIDVYPRYAAGVIWEYEKDAVITYFTIDQARRNWSRFYKSAGESKYTIVIAGVVVPGKYLSAQPLTPKEAVFVGERLSATRTFSILAGPAAKFGMGLEGGRPAVSSRVLERYFDASVRGDVEVYLKDLLEEGEEKAEPWRRREDYSIVDRVAPIGAQIVRQHPNHGYNLIVEIETYKGCARWVSGGCSFCVEPLYGRPLMREPEAILKEIRSLYSQGVRAFRLGRQADILVYGSEKIGLEEFPPPNTVKLRMLFEGARKIIGDSLLHIDNVNPGTITHNPTESLEALKIIVKYHTPGDVAAMGLESADERVIKLNNLNTTPEETLQAIRIVNRVGSRTGWNGMPHLLPGINFVLGLPGETRETYEKNLSFLETIAEEGLKLRRINIRKAMPLPDTRLFIRWNEKLIRRHEKDARSFVWKVRHYYDIIFLKRAFPPGILLRNVYVEVKERGVTYARPVGSYPITIELTEQLEPPCIVDVRVVGWKGRSLKGIVARRVECNGSSEYRETWRIAGLAK